MIKKYNEYNEYDIINEKIHLNNDFKDNLKEVSILFMDMVKSSEKWIKNEKEMLSLIVNVSEFIDDYINDYNGLIIKSIGDAYMIKFDTLYDSVNFGLFILNQLKKIDIKFENKHLEFRIGICYGNVYEIQQDIQNYKLIDYLGNIVNTASRIESKVSDNNSLAFASIINKKDSKLDNLLKDYKIEEINFNNSGEENKRSFRLLSDIQKRIFKNIKELKGVDNITVYKIK